MSSSPAYFHTLNYCPANKTLLPLPPINFYFFIKISFFSVNIPEVRETLSAKLNRFFQNRFYIAINFP